MTRLLTVIVILLGAGLVTSGTLIEAQGAATELEVGTVLIGAGSVLLGRSLQFRTNRWLSLGGVLLAAIAVALSVWGFSGSFEHDEYPAFGGIALFGAAGFVIGLGLGTWPRRERSTRVY
jgi:hypothetical protein